MNKIYNLLFIVLLVFTACNSGSKLTENVIRIGTDATYTPFETIDVNSRQLVGFDIDLMKKICCILDKKPEFIIVPFDGIIAGLKQKKYDMVISAMTITNERAQIINFSHAYCVAGQSIVVNKDNNKITDEKGLEGKKIGVQLGTTGEMLAKRIKSTKVTSYDNITSAFIDLEQRRLDAIINDIGTNKSIIAEKTKLGKCNVKRVGKLLTKEYYGIGIRKDDTELLKKVNVALSEIRKSGYLKQLTKKWNIED